MSCYRMLLFDEASLSPNVAVVFDRRSPWILLPVVLARTIGLCHAAAVMSVSVLWTVASFHADLALLFTGSLLFLRRVARLTLAAAARLVDAALGALKGWKINFNSYSR